MLLAKLYPAPVVGSINKSSSSLFLSVYIITWSGSRFYIPFCRTVFLTITVCFSSYSQISTSVRITHARTVGSVLMHMEATVALVYQASMARTARKVPIYIVIAMLSVLFIDVSETYFWWLLDYRGEV